MAPGVGAWRRGSRRICREARFRADRLPPTRLGALGLGRLRRVPMSGLLILVAGPYRSGTDGDPARIQANVDAMTRTALELWRRGHLPVMGEWFALPLIEAAIAAGDDPDAAYDAIFHPVAEQILGRCDGCLRIGGASEGADRMVATARRLGKRVFSELAEVPVP